MLRWSVIAVVGVVVLVALFTVVFPWVDTLIDDPAVETERR